MNRYTCLSGLALGLAEDPQVVELGPHVRVAGQDVLGDLVELLGQRRGHEPLDVGVEDDVEVLGQKPGGVGQVSAAGVGLAGVPEAAQRGLEVLGAVLLLVQLDQAEQTVSDELAAIGALVEQLFEVLDRAVAALDLLHAVDALAVQPLGARLAAVGGRGRQGEQGEGGGGDERAGGHCGEHGPSPRRGPLCAAARVCQNPRVFYGS
ncbi:hypothetical protein OV079_17710 [Nannocystis pusilla]|uniref:Uncharacterized protein n=1 Tax=Nannocystis pusilla TaxID=889268 RepID=A0A9X3EP72_9BACT|nr:hypothetical protein [Nannocystis pusilla]MCY1007355.1 hypothetical protein [Nannocystis pusilla]